MSQQRRSITFSGNVQGVGFRYTACRTAEGFEVVGTVRNLPDGRVRCVVEGEREQIDAFVEALSKRMSGYIRDRAEQTEPYRGDLRGFGVVY